MPLTELPMAAVGVSFVFALILTPLVRRAAFALGVVDAPDGHRKLHGRTVALGGGVAVFLSMLISLVAGISMNMGWGVVLRSDPPFMIAISVCSTLIVLLGLLDDKLQLRGRQKLVGQIAIVFALAYFGNVNIQKIAIFGADFDLGPMALPFTMFWLLGAINALNLIDGIDGLATTVGVVFSVAMAVMAAMTDHAVDAICCLTMAGSLAGFLVYNLPPAKIFLGDAGSMLIGLVLGVLAIRSSLKGPATVALAAPTAIWGILIFDVGMAILRRKLTGRSLYETDRGHLHHVLLKRGFSVLTIVFIVGAMCTICATGALVSVFFKSEAMAVATLAAVLGTLVATRFFGHSECHLLWQKVGGAAASLVRLPHREQPESKTFKSRFQGKRKWEDLWEALLELAERFDLHSVRMNVSSPSIGEEYHASWDRKEQPAQNRSWKTELPLTVGNLTVGRMIISGSVTDQSAFGHLAEFVDALRPFEEQFLALLEPGDGATVAEVASRLPKAKLNLP